MNSFDPHAYEASWTALVSHHPPPVPDYFNLHRRRYQELFEALTYYLSDLAAPTVLEVGTSGFLPLYKQLFPQLVLTTLDRPVELNGMTPQYCVHECGASRHYSIDLNQVLLAPASGNPPLGKFDFVICTEVLEHLLVHPVEFIASLLALLNPQGYLYLTTPNFLSFDHLKAILDGHSPLPIYPLRGQQQDQALHFREYTLNELITFTEQAGGTIVTADYSDCWDRVEVRQQILGNYPELASNQVLVATASNFAGRKRGKIVRARPASALLPAFQIGQKRHQRFHLTAALRTLLRDWG
jgi:hypothetical protein